MPNMVIPDENIWALDTTLSGRTWCIYGPNLSCVVWADKNAESIPGMVEVSPRRFVRADVVEFARRLGGDGSVVRVKLRHNDWCCDIFKDWDRVRRDLIGGGADETVLDA